MNPATPTFPRSGVFDRFRYKVMRLRLQASRYTAYCREAGPRWALMFVLSRFLPVRAAVTAMQRAPDFKAWRGRPTLFPSIDPESFADDCEREGFAQGLPLPNHIVAVVAAYGRQAEGYRNNQERGLIYLTDYLDVRRDLPVLVQMERDPVLLEIAARYLCHEPVHVGTRLWWATARRTTLSERTKFGQELFHYDLHDYRTLKFCWYLTDVIEAGGGTACIRGSHKRKRFAHQATLFIGRTDAEIVEFYGQEAQHVMIGNAGTGFAFDPYTFHRGTRPAVDRLMLQIEFGRNRYLRNCYADSSPLKP
jgi:hypothetical protein